MVTLSPLAIATGLIALAVIFGVVVTLVRVRKSARLRDRFGDEYQRTVEDAGGTHRGETVLHERERRVAALDIRPLSPSRREDFILAWRQVQAQFVDDPAGAVMRADVLLTDVMNARGYPVAEFEQRYEDISVDHGEVVAHYRTGHHIAESHARGEGGTEELRRAMIHYRALFDDLVNEPEDFGPVIEHRGGRVHDLRREPVRRN
ncbi:hypothetical protein [Novosphingobium resinovorum]|uniref:hypothetical protein n=1 Tax=Novosphingobium resinovorum TaxID=158500 RepID=UPI002ED0A422|nr:hypothetical protein [Novosphingobium resinovorum]